MSEKNSGGIEYEKSKSLQENKREFDKLKDYEKLDATDHDNEFAEIQKKEEKINKEKIRDLTTKASAIFETDFTTPVPELEKGLTGEDLLPQTEFTVPQMSSKDLLPTPELEKGLTSADLLPQAEFTVPQLDSRDLLPTPELEKGLTGADLLPQTEFTEKQLGPDDLLPIPELKIPLGTLTKEEESDLKQILSPKRLMKIRNEKQQQLLMDLKNNDIKEFIKRNRPLRSRIINSVKNLFN
ncbi:MAG: hypothetical protein ACD_5C00008G0003 [uncultured bacterium]|nr:MAG: hypothetical protein ACD_5C00008G0003 [uncultured bacterium]